MLSYVKQDKFICPSCCVSLRRWRALLLVRCALWHGPMRGGMADSSLALKVTRAISTNFCQSKWCDHSWLPGEIQAKNVPWKEEKWNTVEQSLLPPQIRKGSKAKWFCSLLCTYVLWVWDECPSLSSACYLLIPGLVGYWGLCLAPSATMFSFLRRQSFRTRHNDTFWSWELSWRLYPVVSKHIVAEETFLQVKAYKASQHVP